MATELEFYKNSNTSQGGTAGTAYQTHTTLNINRSGATGSKDFYILAHISTTVEDVSVNPKIRLYLDDSTTLGEVNDGLTYSGTTPHGCVYNFVKKITLSAASHNIKIQYASTAILAYNVYAENSAIVAIEASEDSEFQEITSATGTGASTSWVDAVTLTFTPSSEEDYIFIWAGEFMEEDEDDANVGGVQFLNDTDTVIYAANNWGELVDPANDSVYFTQGGCCFDTVQASSHSFKIQIKGGGTAAEVYARNAAIVAIPVSDFANIYTDSQTSKTFHAGLSFSDSNCVLSQSVNSADHMVIGGVQISNEHAGQVGYCRMVVNATNFVGYNLFDRDEDFDEYYCFFLIQGVALTSGTLPFEIEGNSDSTSGVREGCIYNAFLVVAEIEPPSAGLTVLDFERIHRGFNRGVARGII